MTVGELTVLPLTPQRTDIAHSLADDVTDVNGTVHLSPCSLVVPVVEETHLGL